jgi:hypothetical protein
VWEFTCCESKLEVDCHGNIKVRFKVKVDYHGNIN